CKSARISNSSAVVRRLSVMRV
ncbi:hlyD secretion family protein, partial [Vibrio parahaemolyticus V-223/04]